MTWIYWLFVAGAAGMGVAAAVGAVWSGRRAPLSGAQEREATHS